MAKHSDVVYLKHIRDAIVRIESLVARGDRELFDADFAIQNAIIRELEIIGEAARQVSQEFWIQHPDIPKKEIIGMRDWLIHGYSEVEQDKVWETATIDIPELKKLLSTISIS